MSDARTCQRAGCTSPATHQGEIVIYALGAGLLTPPARGRLDLVVCTEHATDASAAELLTEGSKANISEGFRRTGLVRPDWTRSFIRWAPLGPPSGSPDDDPGLRVAPL